MRALTEIILHATATRPDWRDGQSTAAKVAEVRRWHVEDRGWRDIGYHYLIDRDGTLAPGRPLEQTGAHVIGRNTGTVGIALFGGHGSSARDLFDDNFTADQDRAVRKLIASLSSRFPSIRKVSGHNEYAAKACPGFKVPEFMSAHAEASATPATSSGAQVDPVEVARWRIAAIRDAAQSALDELPDPV